MKRLKINGQRFGRLKVIEFMGINSGHTKWQCRCDCGNTVIVSANNLKSGNTKSCGCLDKENLIKACSKKEGEASFNRLYVDYKKHAKKKNLIFDLSKDEFRKITSQNCYYCGTNPEQISNPSKKGNNYYIYNGIDRFEPSLGYIKSNCVPACKNCNFAKRNMNSDEFLSLIKRIYDHQRLLRL